MLLFTGPFIVFAADTGYKETETLTLYDSLGTSLKWRATAWESLVGDVPFDNPAARICFWHDKARKEQQCFLSEDQGASYQSVEQLSLIQLRKNGKPEYGVLFVTRNLSPGIGKLRLFSIWA
ncbi:MAG TPA: hypothetical protein VLX12_06590, partial [Syntrophorhabdales bacterium]|nr:hypothetical protein [Syntrophorhabdales bacterium]